VYHQWRHQGSCHPGGNWGYHPYFFVKKLTTFCSHHRLPVLRCHPYLFSPEKMTNFFAHHCHFFLLIFKFAHNNFFSFGCHPWRMSPEAVRPPLVTPLPCIALYADLRLPLFYVGKMRTCSWRWGRLCHRLLSYTDQICPRVHFSWLDPPTDHKQNTDPVRPTHDEAKVAFSKYSINILQVAEFIFRKCEHVNMTCARSFCAVNDRIKHYKCR